jgi:hypothetical protein
MIDNEIEEYEKLVVDKLFETFRREKMFNKNVISH